MTEANWKAGDVCEWFHFGEDVWVAGRIRNATAGDVAIDTHTPGGSVVVYRMLGNVRRPVAVAPASEIERLRRHVDHAGFLRAGVSWTKLLTEIDALAEKLRLAEQDRTSLFGQERARTRERDEALSTLAERTRERDEARSAMDDAVARAADEPALRLLVRDLDATIATVREKLGEAGRDRNALAVRVNEWKTAYDAKCAEVAEIAALHAASIELTEEALARGRREAWERAIAFVRDTGIGHQGNLWIRERMAAGFPSDWPAPIDHAAVPAELVKRAKAWLGYGAAPARVEDAMSILRDLAELPERESAGGMPADVRRAIETCCNSHGWDRASADLAMGWLQSQAEGVDHAAQVVGPAITRADAREILEMSETTTSEACYERVRAALRAYAGGDFECHETNPLDVAKAKLAEALAEVERLKGENASWRWAGEMCDAVRGIVKATSGESTPDATTRVMKRLGEVEQDSERTERKYDEARGIERQAVKDRDTAVARLGDAERELARKRTGNAHLHKLLDAATARSATARDEGIEAAAVIAANMPIRAWVGPMSPTQGLIAMDATVEAIRSLRGGK